MSPSYQDLEPDYQHKKGKAHDIIEFHVKDFRNDQLKVHVGWNGVLTVSVERPLEGSKWIRFRKEFETPKDCKVPEIRARFSPSFLHITMPKKITSSQVPRQDPLTPMQLLLPSSPVQDKRKTKTRENDCDEGLGKFDSGVSAVYCVILCIQVSLLKMERMTAMKVGASLIEVAVLFIVCHFMYSSFMIPLS